MANVRTSIVPPGPRPSLADTPGTSPATTTSQVTALHRDFAVSLAVIAGSRSFAAIGQRVPTAAPMPSQRVPE